MSADSRRPQRGRVAHCPLCTFGRGAVAGALGEVAPAREEEGRGRARLPMRTINEAALGLANAGGDGRADLSPGRAERPRAREATEAAKGASG